MNIMKAVTKAILGTVVAGAMLLAVPRKAEAQRFGVGISIGGPVVYGGYVGPRYVRPYPYAYGYPYYGPGYYGYYGRPYVGGFYPGGYYGRGYYAGPHGFVGRGGFRR